jgi:hypothetical protein
MTGAGSREPGTRNIRALARVFFGRLFENDIFSSSSAASVGVIWLVALIAVPGVMISGSQMFYWAHMQHQPIALQDSSLLQSQAFHVDWVMAVAGLVTMLVWGSLTPDRRDAHVLGPLPVTDGEQAIGRLLALLKFFGMFILAVSVPTAFAFTFVSVGPTNVLQFPGRVAGHVTAVALGGSFIFFTLVNLQLILAALFGPRAIRFVTLPLQFAAMAGMVAALASSESFTRLILEQGGGNAVLWNPAAWFVGVYRWISGDSREVFAALALRGAIGGTVMAAIALLTYPLAHGRCHRNVIASEGRQTGAMSRGWSHAAAALMRPVLRGPLQRGLASYMLATLTRSHPHRLLIGMYAGIAFLLALPIAARLAYLPTTAHLRYAWFSIPLGLVFWLVCGVRVALMMPVEPVANWIFKLTEPVDKRRMLTTVTTVVTFATILPIAFIASAALLLLREQVLAGTVFLIVLLAGLCLTEALTITMKTVPFTCTYLPGQLKLRMLWPFYFVLWLQFVHRLADWGVWAAGHAQRTMRVSAFLIVVWAALRVWHLAKARKITRFVYDEQEPALVTTMDISTMMRQV